MKATTFKTLNTLYEINDKGVHRNSELTIEANTIKEHIYTDGMGRFEKEPFEEARLVVAYYNGEGSLRQMTTTRIQEIMIAS